ncbi:hypothetical protein QBC40DRAFT_352409 [Triangularia verruculosa]|uniref:Uncharacterized protein n=1 Tax=Triangularia verruculosa TaxID=2587418 RepID=A0AAN6XBP8_9PEZI|nr:hypothetical protein QBC40DRAFT_352409 [Triangularia verruculosa]
MNLTPIRLQSTTNCLPIHNPLSSCGRPPFLVLETIALQSTTQTWSSGNITREIQEGKRHKGQKLLDFSTRMPILWSMSFLLLLRAWVFLFYFSWDGLITKAGSHTATTVSPLRSLKSCCVLERSMALDTYVRWTSVVRFQGKKIEYSTESFYYKTPQFATDNAIVAALSWWGWEQLPPPSETVNRSEKPSQPLYGKPKSSTLNEQTSGSQKLPLAIFEFLVTQTYHEPCDMFRFKTKHKSSKEAQETLDAMRNKLEDMDYKLTMIMNNNANNTHLPLRYELEACTTAMPVHYGQQHVVGPQLAGPPAPTNADTVENNPTVDEQHRPAEATLDQPTTREASNFLFVLVMCACLACLLSMLFW